MYQRDGRFLAHANSEITVSLCSTRRLIMPSCGTPPSFLSADWLCSPSVPPIPRFLSLPIIIVLPVCLPTAVCHVSSSNLRDSGIQKFRSRSQTGAKNIAAIPRKLSCSRGDFFVIPDHCSLVCVCVCVSQRDCSFPVRCGVFRIRKIRYLIAKLCACKQRLLCH